MQPCKMHPKYNPTKGASGEWCGGHLPTDLITVIARKHFTLPVLFSKLSAHGVARPIKAIWCCRDAQQQRENVCVGKLAGGLKADLCC